MASLMHSMRGMVANVVAGRPGPRRATSRRKDIPDRNGRPLVTGAAPDHAAPRPAPGGLGVPGNAVQPAMPFAVYTVPRRRIGPVPKLAPGKQGSGLGQVVGAGFQTMQYVGFTPMEASPDTQPDRGIPIPQLSPVAWQPGGYLTPTYKADDFAPATRFFMQNRSSVAWAQSSFPPVQRPLTPSQQGVMVRRPATFARRQIAAAQPNPALYTIGYPTRAAMAARLGAVGPVAVLGGNSQ